MSYISLQSLKSKINELQIIIFDTENEISSLQRRIQDMTLLLNESSDQMKMLNQLLKDKKNIYQDCLNIFQTRVELLKFDKQIKAKYTYMDSCCQYLVNHSSHMYHFDELTIDEIIEYSHKLHFIKCFETWLDHSYENLKIHRSKIFFPQDEFDFSSFEMKHVKNDDHILFSEEVDCHYSLHNEFYDKCQCDILYAYIMDISIWNTLSHFDNPEKFSIHSSFMIFNTILEYTHIFTETQL